MSNKSQISSSARGTQRRLIIGFEANKNTNGNFLRKLDRMIAVSARPKSRVSQHVEDVRFTPGEGIKQLTKAVTALNDRKYAEVGGGGSSRTAEDNLALVQSRDELRSRVERTKIVNNKALLEQREKKIKEAS